MPETVTSMPSKYDASLSGAGTTLWTRVCET